MFPDLPRRQCPIPRAFPAAGVAQRVHALPEIGVTVRHQLPVAGEAFHRFFFPGRLIAFDVLEDLGLQAEERAVDPSFDGLGLLGKLLDAVAFKDHAAESCRRPDGGDGRELAVRLVERQQLLEIYIGDAVAPREQEAFVADERLQPLDPPAGLRVDAGVNQIDGPVRPAIAVPQHVARADRHSQVVLTMP